MLITFLIDSDQPITCPMCGARTDNVEKLDDTLHEKCLNCDYEFIAEFEEED